MKTHTKTLLAALVTSTAVATGSANAAIYSWTGGVDGDWNNAGNWDSNGVPVDTRVASLALDLNAASDKIVFNAGGSANPEPTSNIPTFGWYAFQGTADVPIVDMLDGSLSVTGDGVFQKGFGGNGGITWATVGDGDGFAASLTYSNYSILGRSGVASFVVNADGTLTFTGVDFVGFSSTGQGGGNAGRILINGGSVVLDTEVRDLAAQSLETTAAYVEFNAPGSSFTAEFATSASNDFADLTAVTSGFGTSFRDTTGNGLIATDNLDGTFTVTIVPEPGSLALLGLGGLLIARRRRG